MYKNNHLLEFEKHAEDYDSYAVIQKKVAKELIKKLDFIPKKILDLGCGSGEIYKNISHEIDYFIGVDGSATMCELHPKSENIKIFCDDFDSALFRQTIMKDLPFDLVISSSALQWSKDLESIFMFFKSLSDKVAFAIFTKGTFKSVYDMVDRQSFLPSFDFVNSISKIFENVQVEKKIYRLDFADNYSKFRYITKSGIRGGNEALNYKQIKYLLEKYPHKYLEFEVTFVLN
jgi:malonyl-CoA O-methyltransferase